MKEKVPPDATAVCSVCQRSQIAMQEMSPAVVHAIKVVYKFSIQRFPFQICDECNFHLLILENFIAELLKSNFTTTAATTVSEVPKCFSCHSSYIVQNVSLTNDLMRELCEVLAVPMPESSCAACLGCFYRMRMLKKFKNLLESLRESIEMTPPPPSCRLPLVEGTEFELSQLPIFREVVVKVLPVTMTRTQRVVKRKLDADFVYGDDYHKLPPPPPLRTPASSLKISNGVPRHVSNGNAASTNHSSPLGSPPKSPVVKLVRIDPTCLGDASSETPRRLDFDVPMGSTTDAVATTHRPDSPFNESDDSGDCPLKNLLQNSTPPRTTTSPQPTPSPPICSTTPPPPECFSTASASSDSDRTITPAEFNNSSASTLNQSRKSVSFNDTPEIIVFPRDEDSDDDMERKIDAIFEESDLLQLNDVDTESNEEQPNFHVDAEWSSVIENAIGEA